MACGNAHKVSKAFELTCCWSCPNFGLMPERSRWLNPRGSPRRSSSCRRCRCRRRSPRCRCRVRWCRARWCRARWCRARWCRARWRPGTLASGGLRTNACVIRLAGARLVELPLRDGEVEPHLRVVDPGAVDAVLAARGDLRREAGLHGLFAGLEVVRGVLVTLASTPTPTLGPVYGPTAPWIRQIDVGRELHVRAEGDPDGFEWVDVVLECRVHEWLELRLPTRRSSVTRHRAGDRSASTRRPSG